MSSNVPTETHEQEDLEDETLNPDDYGFIIGANGELKSMLIPESLMGDPPEEIKQILAIFGINDINDLDNVTIH